MDHWINIIAPDPGQPQVTRWNVDITRLTNGFSTGGFAGKDSNGFPLPAGMKFGPDGNGNPGVTGKMNILDIPRSYYGIRGLSGRWRYLWRSDAAQEENGGTVIESNAMPNIPDPVSGGDGTINARGHTWRYQDFDWYPPRNSVTYNIEFIQPDANGNRTIDHALVNHVDLPVWEAGNNVPDDLVEMCSYFGGIRPMRPVGGNHRANNPPFPGFRFVPLSYASYGRGENFDLEELFEPKTMPIEILVELCERANCGLWYNIPCDATPAQIRPVFDYIAANWTDPARPLITESGNEAWNSATGFQTFKEYLERGREIWPDENTVGTNAAVANYAMLQVNRWAPEIEAALAGTGIDHKWALGGSATGNTSFAQQQMDCPFARALGEWDPVYAPENLMTYVGYGMYFGGAEGGFVEWLQRTFGLQYDRAEFYFDMLEAGVGGNVVGPGKNTFPNGMFGSTVGSPSTGYLATDFIRLGDALNRYSDNVPEPRYKQEYIWADEGTPDATDVIRINRGAGPAVLQINLSQVPGYTGPDWHTLAEWAPGETPPTLFDMSRSAQITALGTSTEGVNGQLTRAFEIRFKNHLQFAEDYNLTIVGYEGGNGADGTTGSGGDDLPAPFKFIMHYGDLTKRMQQLYLTFIAEADTDGVALIAWFENASPTNWEGAWQTEDARGLVRTIQLPTPESELPPKFRGGLGLPVL